MDAVTAPEFEKGISGFIEQGEKAFVINLSGLEYISSAGLRSILICARRLKELNGKLIFSGLQGNVKKVFTASNFYEIFKIYDCDAEGLKAV